MASVIPRLMLLMMMIATGLCYCPRDKMHNTGECGFRIYCVGAVRGVGLPEKCQGSSNYPVTVDLTLTEAIERFDDHTIVDADFLVAVTTFRASGVWPQTTLSFLQYMPRLQNLYLIGNQMMKIGSKPFYNLNRLEILDLSRNYFSDISELFKFETHPNKLRKLNLAYNTINEIPANSLEELTSLIELDLSHNFIKKIDGQPFSNLTNLEILKLNNNRIKDLNGAVNNLINLKHLYLRGNEIHHIDDESLKIIFHLETFDVSYNHLETLTPDMFSRHWEHFGGHSVCKIVLSENQITTVPNATMEEFLIRFTRSFKKNSIDVLTELDLSKNSITNLEYNAFRALVRLTSLNLSCNKLITFKVNADDLTYVKYLNLSSNYITSLYFESFLSMNNLQNLDLSHNELDYIPEYTFNNNYRLKNVSMSYNDFRRLKSVQIRMFHPDGGVLDLSNNALTKLTIPSGEGLRMTMLILHSNNISEVNFINLQHQSDLKHLDMSRNYIQYLNSSSLRLPVAVTYLDLNNNEIEDIGPASFRCVSHLNTLRLAHNNLQNIEYGSFQGLTSLLNLDLSHNNIDYLDSKVLMDLKSLGILSLRYNKMHFMDYKGWIGHKTDLKVYIDGNNFSCEWLGAALNDFNNNYSRVRPCVLKETTDGPSLEGIPCVQKSKEIGELINANSLVMTDGDRLLSVNLKILEAIKEQTSYLKKYIWHSMSDEPK